MIRPTRSHRSQSRHWTRLTPFAALFVLIGALAVPAVAAQQTAETPSPVPVPEGLSSPRATMTTFLEAFYTGDEPDFEKAASCLDLSVVPESRRGSRGAILAAQLKEVLDRTRYIDVTEISDDPDAEPWSLKVADGRRIELDRQEDGRWLFTASTVEGLDLMVSEVEDQAVVEGVEKTVDSRLTSNWLRSKAPESLRRRILRLEGWQWIGILVLFVVGLVVGRLAVAILQGPAMLWLRRWAKDVDERLVRSALNPMGALAMVLVWWFGISWLRLPISVLGWYSGLVDIVLILTAALTAYRLVNVLTDVMEKRAHKTVSRFDDLLVPMVRNALKVTVVVAAVVTLADTFDHDFTTILAGLGIGGLAVALAAQNTISNLFGSLTVLIDRPFQVGDWIVVGSAEGVVEEVGFRSTRIRTFYNSRITLPNSQLTSASVDNFGERQYRRWSTRLQVAYNTLPENVDAFCAGIRELILRHPHTRKDYFHVAFNEFGASGLEIMLYVFFVTADWAEELKERHRLGVDIMRLAGELGVEFAFPTQTVYLRQEEWEAGTPSPDFPAASETLREEAVLTARRLTGEPPLESS